MIKRRHRHECIRSADLIPDWIQENHEILLELPSMNLQASLVEEKGKLEEELLDIQAQYKQRELEALQKTTQLENAYEEQRDELTRLSHEEEPTGDDDRVPR